MWWIPAGIGAVVGWEVGRGRRAQSSEETLRSSFGAGRGGAKIFLTYDRATGQYIVRSRWQDFYRSRKGLKPNSAKARAALKRAEDRFETTLLFTPGGTDWKDHGQRAKQKGRRAPSTEKVDTGRGGFTSEERVLAALHGEALETCEQSYAEYAPPKILRGLTAKGYIVRRGDRYTLTGKGLQRADALFGPLHPSWSPGRRAKSYNRRVSSCISGKVRGEGWSQRQAVAACLSMDREKRLRADGSYIRKGQRGKGNNRTLSPTSVRIGTGCGRDFMPSSEATIMWDHDRTQSAHCGPTKVTFSHGKTLDLDKLAVKATRRCRHRLDEWEKSQRIRKGQRGKGKKLTWVGARDYPYQGASWYTMSYYAEVPGGTIGYGKDGHGGTITVWMSRGGEYSLDKTRDGFAFSRVTSYPQYGQPYFGSHRFKTGTEARKAAEAAWAKMQRRSR